MQYTGCDIKSAEFVPAKLNHDFADYVKEQMTSQLLHGADASIWAWWSS